ncbi:MAG TPA: cytochrome c [Terricaulis sp.]|nr:cytochrome c [Terricaulis sp.]HRP10923.1 cytochrome c [Terricaulis sp.]
MAPITLRQLGVCVVLANALAACAGAPKGEAAAGQRIAEANCAACHAIGLTGESAHASAPPLRTLSQKYPPRDLEEALAEGILVGHSDMPEFRLEPAEIDALITYLESVQAPAR